MPRPATTRPFLKPWLISLERKLRMIFEPRSRESECEQGKSREVDLVHLKGCEAECKFVRAENISDWFLTFHLLVSCGDKMTHTITCTMILARQIVLLSLFSILGRKGRHQQNLSKSPRMDYASLAHKATNKTRCNCFDMFKPINFFKQKMFIVFPFPSELIYFWSNRTCMTGFIRLFARTNMPFRRVECLREIVMHEWHFKGYKWVTKERARHSRSGLFLASLQTSQRLLIRNDGFIKSRWTQPTNHW